jgi:hypothetical protein
VLQVVVENQKTNSTEVKTKKSKTEASVESTENEIKIIDLDLWNEDENNQFTLKLFNYLIQMDLLKLWIESNRSCFALADMIKVPSAKQVLINIGGS